MKRSIEDHAARFDQKADAYDDSKTEEHHASASLVVDHADPGSDDVVLDLGTGTGVIALALARDADQVIGRDISEGMLAEAREKATERGIDNVTFAEGRFREPNLEASSGDGAAASREHDGPTVDVVTSNFAMHHLDDAGKREAIQVVADLNPRRFVLGDVMFFGEPDPDEPFYSPEVDDPATVGFLAEAFTDAGFVLTTVERIHDQVGVLVGERIDGQ